MKTIQIIASIAFGSAVVFATGNANAQVVQKLNISGTVTYQAANSFQNNGETTVFNTKQASFNNNTIIGFLGKSTNFLTAAGITNIPKSSILVMIDNGTTTDIFLTNKNANLMINLSTLGFASFTPGEFSVVKGKQSNSSTQQNGDVLSVTGSMMFNDGAGTLILFEGLVTAKFSDSKANNNGQFNESVSGSISGSGQGTFLITLPNNTVGPVDTVVQGKASSSGSAKLTAL